MNGTIHYLNTDMDLASPEDLTGLAEAFKAKGIFPLHVTQGEDGLWYARFEAGENYDQPETSIAAMLTVVESLNEPLRAIWSRCTRREFNMGYDCGSEPWAFEQGLSNALLGRMAALGASLRLTLYPDRVESAEPGRRP